MPSEPSTLQRSSAPYAPRAAASSTAQSLPHGLLPPRRKRAASPAHLSATRTRQRTTQHPHCEPNAPPRRRNHAHAAHRGLRKSHPQARIEFAVEAAGAPLLQQMPEGSITSTHSRSAQYHPSPSGCPLRRALAVTREYWRHMRHATPTICLLPRWGDDLFRSSILAYLTGAPQRIGFSWDVVPKRNTRTLPRQTPHASHPQRQRSPRPTTLLPPRNRSRLAIQRRHRQHRPTHHPCAASHRHHHRLARIAKSPQHKRRPLRHHRARRQPAPPHVAARSLDTNHRSPRKQRPQHHPPRRKIRRIRGARPSGSAQGSAPRLSRAQPPLAESVALIAHAALFLGSDSGPGHIAGALGIPSIILFVAVLGADPDGPSSPERVHPTGPNVLCITPPHLLPPCEGSCLADAPHLHHAHRTASRAASNRRRHGSTYPCLTPPSKSSSPPTTASVSSASKSTPFSRKLTSHSASSRATTAPPTPHPPSSPPTPRNTPSRFRNHHRRAHRQRQVQLHRTPESCDLRLHRLRRPGRHLAPRKNHTRNASDATTRGPAQHPNTITGSSPISA